MRFFIVALALVSSPALSAPPCAFPDLPRIAGKSYHLARGLLIESGARPVLYPPDTATAADATMRGPLALGYLETEACAGSGAGACRFAWETNGTPFFIVSEAGKVRRLLCS